MQCVFPDSVALKRIFATVGQGIELVNLIFTPAGFNISSIDGSKTNLVEINLDASYFTTYRCTQQTKIGIHVVPLLNLMRHVGAKDTVQWTLAKPDGNDKISILVANTDDKVKTMTQYDMRLIDIEEDGLEVPTLTYDAIVRVSSAFFRSWHQKTSITKNNVTFNATENRFEVIAEADEWGKVTIQQPMPSAGAISVKTCPQMSSTTINNNAMTLVDTMVQCTPGVDISFKEGMPLAVVGYFDKDKKSSISVFLAPIMSDMMDDD